MLTKKELKRQYIGSALSSAKLYSHIWELYSKDNKDCSSKDCLSAFPTVEEYVLAQVGHMNENPEWSNIGIEIDSFLHGRDYKLHNVLSVGCGVANDLKMITKYGDNLIVGVDVGMHALKLAKSNAPKADLICASATHLPFRNSVFGTIITGHLFDAMPEKQCKYTFDEIKRCSSYDSLWFVSIEAENFFDEYLLGNLGEGRWKVIYKNRYTSEVPPIPDEEGYPHGAEFLVLKNR